VDTLVTAEAIKDVSDSIDRLLSFENMYILVTLFEMTTGKEILPGTPNDIYQLIDWSRAWFADNPVIPTLEEFGEEYTGLGGFVKFVFERGTIAGWFT